MVPIVPILRCESYAGGEEAGLVIQPLIWPICGDRGDLIISGLASSCGVWGGSEGWIAGSLGGNVAALFNSASLFLSLRFRHIQIAMMLVIRITAAIGPTIVPIKAPPASFPPPLSTASSNLCAKTVCVMSNNLAVSTGVEAGKSVELGTE